jgi:Sec-independent protein secretion pathway component TatC
MVSKWVTIAWAYIADYTRWADAWTLFVSGIIAAGITLPADGQPNRTWAFATLVVLFNLAVNAVRRAKTTVVPFR